jgi:hypothetical protein
MERTPTERISEDEFSQSRSENSSSDEESIGSVGKSLVSTNFVTSGKSLSSISEEVSSEVIALLATERLVKLIVEDIMAKSFFMYAYAFKEHPMLQKDFRRNLVRFLRLFGMELQTEAQTDYERQAAQRFRIRAWNTAHLICDRVVSRTDYLDEESEVELDDCSDDASDASKYISTCLQGLKTFVRDSRAHLALRKRLSSLVRSPEAISSFVATGEQEPGLQQQDQATTSDPDKGSEDTGIKLSLDASKVLLPMDDMIDGMIISVDDIMPSVTKPEMESSMDDVKYMTAGMAFSTDDEGMRRRALTQLTLRRTESEEDIADMISGSVQVRSTSFCSHLNL